jgi:NAD+ diphosphatase
MRPADAAPNLAPPHVYAGGSLDRAAERRGDEAWLGDRRADPSSRVVLVAPAGLLVPVSGPEDRPRLAAPSVEVLGRPAAQDSTLLGVRDGVAWFAEAGDEEELAGDPGEEEPRRQVDLRAVGTLLPADEASLLAYARALLHWQARSPYCPVCGNPALLVQAGHVRRCTGCGADHFPRTDPAVIVLVTSGGDLCLLGRSPRFPPGMYSTLAGFVEPGESLEETVRREVLEESGVEVGDVVYRSSQPWPFPQSLMLGFRARASTTALRIDPEEIEDARWLTRAELRRDPDRRPVKLPRPDSIARFLIEEWLAED